MRRTLTRAAILRQKFGALSVRHAASVAAPTLRQAYQRRYNAKDSGGFSAAAAAIAAAAATAATAAAITSGRADCDAAHVRVEGTRRQLNKQYKFGRVLGEGSFAVVRQATDKATKRKYAVKQISKKLSDAWSLKNEVDVMREIGEHVNLVSLRGVFDSEETLYLVMDLVEGGELFDRIIDEGELSEREASRLFREAVQGINHMHLKRIVHLDIKPENLLLTSHSKAADVKLADFGLAVKLQTPNDKCCDWVGTPAYWPPEMVKKEPFDCAVDIWALGCVLYIMLCGTHPFDPQGDAPEPAILARVVEGDYDTKNTQYRAISASAKDLLRHLLDPDPSRRYTAKQALMHPWLDPAEDLSDEPLMSVKYLRMFRLLCTLKMIGSAANVFDSIDSDGDGFLTREEIEEAMGPLIEAADSSIEQREKIVDDVWNLMRGDENRSDRVSKEEFEAVMSRARVASTPSSSIAEYEKLFGVFDRSGDGYIYEDDLRHMLSLVVGEAAITDEVVSAHMKRADKDNDGRMDFAEFVTFVRTLEVQRANAPRRSSIVTPRRRSTTKKRSSAE